MFHFQSARNLYELQGFAQGYLPPPTIAFVIEPQHVGPVSEIRRPLSRIQQLGLGLSLGDKFQVQHVKYGGPCHGKVEVGDTLLSVNGQGLEGKSTAGIVALTQGDEGSTAVLTVRRGAETLDLIVVRKFSDTMLDEMNSRVDLGFKRRDIEQLKQVFEKYSDGTGNIPEEKLLVAMKEFDAIPDLSDEDMANSEKLRQKLDTNDDGVVDFDEFVHAVQHSIPEIEWSRQLPLTQILEDALPRRAGTNTILLPKDFTEEHIVSIIGAFSHGLRRCLGEMKRQYVSRESAVQGLASLRCGNIADFHEGLPPRIGHPHLQFVDAMTSEHCNGEGANFLLKTTNTELETTPIQEWKIVNGIIECPDHLITKKRRIPRLDDLLELPEARQAGLIKIEAVAIVLYSGPMYHVYNSVLRRYPQEIYEFFKRQGNLFATTIHVLVSAVQKLSRVTRIEPGTKLYRGLGFDSELPDHFFKLDRFDVGFHTMTEVAQVALEYSKVAKANPSPKVLVFTVWSVDRGACIRNFSQYPEEVEYLFVPCSFLERRGPVWYEKHDGQLVAMASVRVNANLKAKTLEQLQEEKKGFHISAFLHLIRDVGDELKLTTEKGQAEARLTTDSSRGNGHTLQGYLDRILQDCQDVLNRHKAVPANKYADTRVFRRLVLEMIEVHAMAMSKLKEWLENTQSSFICFRWSCALRTAQRRYITFLRREMDSAEDKTRIAGILCKMMGLFSESVEEVNELKETSLMRAAADGAANWILRLLVCARADVNASRPDGVTAMWLAAQFGQVDAVKSLHELSASVDKAANDGAAPVYIAAQNGHAHCIAMLHSLKADVRARDKKGLSAMDQALLNKHDDCCLKLKDLGGKINRDHIFKAVLTTREREDSRTTIKILTEKMMQINQDRLQEVQQAIADTEASSAAEGGFSRQLVVTSGDLSDVDGFFAVAQYGKTGADLLFVMNYPAYVGVAPDEEDAGYAESHFGLGYRYGAAKVLERDQALGSAKYLRLLERYEADGADRNLVMKRALTDVAFAVATRVWGECQPPDGMARGQLFFRIGGVNSINPFSEKAIKNEVLIFADLLEDPSSLATLSPAEGVVYDEVGAPATSFSLRNYADIYLDFCGSMAFWNEDWEAPLRQEQLHRQIRGAFIMGGVLTNERPVTLPPIKGVLNRISSATMNQLYHPENTGRFFSFVNEFRVPAFVATNNCVGDLSTFAADGDRRQRTDEGWLRFLQGNQLTGEFLNALARAYYNSPYNPARKPFDYYCALALTRHMEGGGEAMALSTPQRNLFYGSVYGTTFVSEQLSWDDARAEYIDTVAGLAGDLGGELGEARERETGVVKDMNREASLNVYSLRFRLGDDRRLEVCLDGP